MTQLQEAYEYAVQARWAGSKNAEWAVRNARRVVEDLNPELNVEDLTTRDIMGLRDHWLSEGLSGSTVNRRLSALSVMLQAAEDLGATVKAKVRRAKEGKPREFVFSEESLETVRNALRQSRHRALVDFLASTGCRLGEALGLRWDDVTNSQAAFRDTKNGSSRTIPLSSRAMRAVRSQPREGRGPFSSVSRWAFSADWTQARLRAGLPQEAVPHCLRHTFATQLLADGVPMARVQAWLGHQAPATTMRYTHLTAKHLEQDLEKIQ